MWEHAGHSSRAVQLNQVSVAAERPQQVFHHLLHHKLPGLFLELLGTVQTDITDESRAHVTEEGNMQRARSLLVDSQYFFTPRWWPSVYKAW